MHSLAKRHDDFDRPSMDLADVTSNTELPEKDPGASSVPLAVVCVVLVALDLRPSIVSSGPLLPMIQQDLGITSAQAALLTAIPAALMGLLAFPTPWLARRYGRDRVVLAALILLALATAARAFSESIGALIAGTVAIGAGIAIAGTLIGGFIKTTFPQQIAVVMGIYAMSIGLGSMIGAALAGPLASLGGSWRFGSGIFALPGLMAIAAWLFVTRKASRSVKAHTATTPSNRSAPPLSNRTAWLAAAYFSANNIVFFGMVAWTAPIFRDAGMSAATAGLVLAAFTAGFTLGNPVAGLVSRKRDRRVVLASFAVLVVIGSFGITVAPTLAPFLLVSMMAFGIGGSFTLAMVLPLDNTSNADEANAWTAFIMGVGYFVGASGPLLLGILRDMTGSFDWPLATLVVASLVMLLLSPLLKPRAR